jgi:hypothetical protein
MGLEVVGCSERRWAVSRPDVRQCPPVRPRSAIVRCREWEGVAGVWSLQLPVEHRRAAVAVGVRLQRLREEAAVRVTGTPADKAR